MIAEFQFDTTLLRTAVRESTVGAVTIEDMDASGDVPLRAVCWHEGDRTDQFERALAADRTVDEATRVVDTPRGTQYAVTCDQQDSGTELYYAAVDAEGIYVSGIRRPDHWEVQMRFPDRESFRTFRDSLTETELSVQSIHHQEAKPRAKRYDISEPQYESLAIASERGYFDVPRRASLADIADDLGVSSQAASERLRRGLDSLVERALVPSE